MKMISRKFFLLLLLLQVLKLQAQKTLFLDRQEYSCAGSFNIALRAKSISNVVAIQGSVVWDTSVLKYTGINFGNAAIALGSSNVNLLSTANGQMSFLWFDENLQGQSVADSTALFTLSFTPNGTGKGKGFINFSGTPTSLEIDTLAAGGLPVNDQSAMFNNGYIITPTAYHFVGSGNWSTTSNWSNHELPPAVLPACSEIIIEPAGAGQCLLDLPQALSAGARLTVVPGKNLTVMGNLIIR